MIAAVEAASSWFSLNSPVGEVVSVIPWDVPRFSFSADIIGGVAGAAAAALASKNSWKCLQNIF